MAEASAFFAKPSFITGKEEGPGRGREVHSWLSEQLPSRWDNPGAGLSNLEVRGGSEGGESRGRCHKNFWVSWQMGKDDTEQGGWGEVSVGQGAGGEEALRAPGAGPQEDLWRKRV